MNEESNSIKLCMKLLLYRGIPRPAIMNIAIGQLPSQNPTTQTAMERMSMKQLQILSLPIYPTTITTTTTIIIATTT